MFTHLFNAMRPLGHRDPGVIAAALTSAAAMPAIIPDAVHVHPRIMRLVYAARGAGGMILTTDKVSLAGAPADASMPVGRARAQIVSGAARLPDGTIAGSVISMLDGVRMMVREAGASISEAALMAASNPAALLGIRERGRLQAGSISDMIVLNPEMELKSVFVAGRELN
jgi:N-acetylglucosamine-6-phosphate deacetylase